MSSSSPSLDMSSLPPIFVTSTHFQTEDLHEVEDLVYRAAGRLTYDATEARIFLTKVRHQKRVALDLRSKGVWTKEEALPALSPAVKKRKFDRSQVTAQLSGSETESADDTGSSGEEFKVGRKRKRSLDVEELVVPDLEHHVVVLKVEWLDDCIKHNKILNFDSYRIYSGRIIDKPKKDETPKATNDQGVRYIKALPDRPSPSAQSSLNYVSASQGASQVNYLPAHSQHSTPSFHRRKFGAKSTSLTLSSPPKLYRATTTEMEGGNISNLPPEPDWMQDPHPRPMYSCLRSTYPLEINPNRFFINQLLQIKESRILTLDEIGVRAYSTSIASLSAYPHRITSPIEITRLPGCNDKIASLWIEWHESKSLSSRSSPDPSTITHPTFSPEDDASLDPHRTSPTVLALQQDPTLRILRTFYQIWGVGAETARKLHFQSGYTDLDDIIEFGWSSLTRAQQIGLKFNDDFALPIPRAEVEDISRVVLNAARKARNIPREHYTNDVISGHNGATRFNPGDPRDFIAAIVGGYRRGKSHCGDVDVIISHRDERMTQDLILDLVDVLEKQGNVTHTLTLHSSMSERHQSTLPFRHGGGHGFDSLDKALCVWQNLGRDEVRDGSDTNVKVEESSDGAQNDENGSQYGKSSPKRRVDIIISPWRTVGCAVLGWSGGTTFQRDLRRWVKRERGWKFDSSGVRDRGNGRVLDLESRDGGDDDGGHGETEAEAKQTSKREGNIDGDDEGIDGWEDREKRLMINLGIGWRPACERCTG